jgi:ubiquinol-cytochrome c reductase cytochrome c subunit
VLRRLVRSRFLIPLCLMAGLGLGVLSLGGGTGAQSESTTSTTVASAPTTVGGTAETTTTAGSGETTTTAPESSTTSATPTPISATPTPVSAGSQCTLNTKGVTTSFNSGGPHSSVQHRNSQGCLVAYGNRYIIYQTPPASYVLAGQTLFQTYCSTCHGTDASGNLGRAPNLLGLGPATVDFWVATGRMPAVTTAAVQAPSKPPKLNQTQALQVAAYVNSLDPGTPFIPVVNQNGADVANGADLFAINCASCHTITGMGDALAYDTFSSSLHQATPTQIAEAIRTGPANMPRFTGNLSDRQVRDLVAYVSQYIQHPRNPGGVGLGGVGPVAEGFVALLFGVGGLVLICFWIGDRA